MTTDEKEDAASTEQQLYLLAAGLAGLLLFRSMLRQPRSQNATSDNSRPDSTSRRGRQAETPSQIPVNGWKDVLLRTYAAISEGRITALAAASTYYVLLAIFPATAALVAIYGLFSDPANIGQQLSAMQGLLPGGAMDVLGEELNRLTSQSNSTLGLALVTGVLIALWSANSGVKALFDSLNQVYKEEETRSFIKLNVVTLSFTLASIAMLAVALAAIVVLPAFLDSLGLSSIMAVAARIGRWPLLFILLSFALAFIYRFGPNRREPKWRWVSWGSATAALLWIIVSLLFSWYVQNFGSFNKTYGSLGAVIGFMVWIWISMIVVLLGAELDAELEHQTARDTTARPERPRGQRGAYMADTVGTPT